MAKGPANERKVLTPNVLDMQPENERKVLTPNVLDMQPQNERKVLTPNVLDMQPRSERKVLTPNVLDMQSKSDPICGVLPKVKQECAQVMHRLPTDSSLCCHWVTKVTFSCP